MTSQENFWDNVTKYRELGMDPLRWVAGCAVKVDLNSVVYPALRQIKPKLKELGVFLGDRVDADVFPKTNNELELSRIILDPKNPEIDSSHLARINPTRAISLIQLHQRNADQPEKFANILLGIYNVISTSNVKFFVGKGHSIITGYADAEFSLFDFISEDNGNPEGWNLANNDTIQIIDPTADPGSYSQSAAAVSNSLNDLITLGCYEDIKIHPVIDSPNDELFNQISKNMYEFSNRYNVDVVESLSPNKGKLLIGATITGSLHKEPPTKLDLLKENMEILVTRPFGDLAPINVYLSCVADPDFLTNLESQGYNLDQVENAKQSVIDTMSVPNLKVAQIINEYLPNYGGQFDTSEHILATGDLSGPGILIFKEAADNGHLDIELTDIPLKYPEYVKFATENFLMDNATAGTNGAIALMAEHDILSEVSGKLKREGYDPQFVGKILGKGEGHLFVNSDVKNSIASKSLLDELDIKN